MNLKLDPERNFYQEYIKQLVSGCTITKRAMVMS